MKKLLALMLAVMMLFAFAGCNSGDKFTKVTEEEREEIIDSLPAIFAEAATWKSYKIVMSDSDEDMKATIYCNVEEGNEGFYAKISAEGIGMTLALKDGKAYIDMVFIKASMDMDFKEFMSDFGEEFSLETMLEDLDFEDMDDVVVSSTATEGARTIKIYESGTETEYGFTYSFVADMRLKIDAEGKLVSINFTYKETYAGMSSTMKMSIEPFSGSIPFPSSLNETNYPPMDLWEW